MFIISSASALILDCTYSTSDFWTRTKFYTCIGRIVKLGDPRIVTDVTQNHQAGRNNSDVTGLKISQQALGLLPHNIGAFFLNLQAYESDNSGLTKLSREDFQDMPNLILGSFRWNEYSEVDNIFSRNPKLQVLHFGHSPRRHVSARAFDHLTELDSLAFYQATCIDQTAVSDRNGVLNIISNLARSCPPSPRMNMEEMLESEEFEKALNQKIANQINPLTWTVNQHEKKIEELKEQLQSLQLCCKNTFLKS